MHIFVIVGMPASGKNIARDDARAKGFPYFSTGDIVRQEVFRQGLTPDATTMARISDLLRGPDGQGVTRAALTRARATLSEFVFLEGMRSWGEIELIRAEAPVVVLAFLAPPHVRKARMLDRGRSDDSVQAFASRDAREIAYGASVPIALADEYVLNTGTPEAAWERMDAIITTHTRTPLYGGERAGLAPGG